MVKIKSCTINGEIYFPPMEQSMGNTGRPIPTPFLIDETSLR